VTPVRSLYDNMHSADTTHILLLVLQTRGAPIIGRLFGADNRPADNRRQSIIGAPLVVTPVLQHSDTQRHNSAVQD